MLMDPLKEGVWLICFGLVSGTGSDRLSLPYLVKPPNVFVVLPYPAREGQAVPWVRSEHRLSGRALCCVKGPFMSGFAPCEEEP